MTDQEKLAEVCKIFGWVGWKEGFPTIRYDEHGDPEFLNAQSLWDVIVVANNTYFSDKIGFWTLSPMGATVWDNRHPHKQVSHRDRLLDALHDAALEYQRRVMSGDGEGHA